MTLPPLPDKPVCDLCGINTPVDWWEYRTAASEHVDFQDPRWLVCNDCHEIVSGFRHVASDADHEAALDVTAQLLAQRQLRIFRKLYGDASPFSRPLDEFMRTFLTHLDGAPVYERKQ